MGRFLIPDSMYARPRVYVECTKPVQVVSARTRLGLAVVRCGESQCSRVNTKLFDIVQVSNNVAPVSDAVNQAVKACFDAGATWVVQLDGDMCLTDQEILTIRRDIANAGSHDCIQYKIQDTYINRPIYGLRVMNANWFEKGGWWQDEPAPDRAIRQRALAQGCRIWETGKVIGTHFDNPTIQQIFRRFYVRGMKAKAGVSEEFSYRDILTGVALEAYDLGYQQPLIGTGHDIRALNEVYDKWASASGLVCGVCAWGDFPYHFHGTQHIKKTDTRYVKPGQRDSTLKAKYINRLAIGVGQNMPVPHKMFYLAPEPVKGVISDCHWQPLDSPYPSGNLNKFGMYNTSYLDKGNTFITFDLDNVPLHDLRPMYEAVLVSNGFVTRSDIIQLKKNICGGDMIGYTRSMGFNIHNWLMTCLPAHSELIGQGQERFVYRRMIEDHPQWGQHWHELLRHGCIAEWKPQVRHAQGRIDSQAMLLSVWGDWAIHEINQPWVQIWKDRYEDIVCHT